MEGIVIGVDESPGAAAALRWGLREAKVRGCVPTAVLGWGTLDRHYVILGERFDRGYDLQEAGDALLAVMEQQVGVDAARQVARRVVCDSGAHALVSAAAGADLLVVGARGGGGFPGLALGSVADQCLHHAPCPVAIVRPAVAAGADEEPAEARQPATRHGPETGTAEPAAEAPSPRRVIVGVDGSPAAQAALRWAIAAARAHRADLEVVHVWQPRLDLGEAPGTLGHEAEAADKEARHVVELALDKEDVSALARPPVVTTISGPAAATMLNVARRADVIVLGARGGGGFAGLRLGSVGHQLATHASCTVVVVPDVPARERATAGFGGSAPAPIR